MGKGMGRGSVGVHIVELKGGGVRGVHMVSQLSVCPICPYLLSVRKHKKLFLFDIF